MIRYLSVCSGIEAATVAWHPLGWSPVAFSEVDAFPRAVLAQHYPTVPNWGDMTQFKDWPDANVDLLVGGTPCQSFSVAGLRKGLADPRGNLALTYLAILDRYRPAWCVWENVPGVLSADGGRALGAFLGGLGQLGYGFAYRVLDAQHFGLAQRRARVFVVGHLGDWRRAAAVLFERESLSGHPAPRREAGKTAPTIPSRSTAGGRLGTDFDCDGGLIASDTAPTIGQHMRGQIDAMYDGALVAHSLRAEGFDASEDGTGSGTPLVPVAFAENQRGELTVNDTAGSLKVGGGKPGQGYPAVLLGDDYAGAYEADASSVLSTLRSQVGAQAVAEWGSRILDSLQRPEVLRTWLHGASIRHASSDFRSFVDDRPLSREEGAAAATLRKVWQEGPDGRSSQGRGLAKQLAQQLGTALPELPSQDTSRVMQVRILTPRECERLMGFPDDYTLITYRGKPAADGPRYKALGNSMAVPVMAWIGQRIAMVDAIAAIPSTAAIGRQGAMSAEQQPV